MILFIIYLVIFSTGYKYPTIQQYFIYELRTGKLLLVKVSHQIMDKLLAIEEMEFDSSATSTVNQKVDFQIDPEKYRNYLSLNPIWKFLSLSKDEYFKLSADDRKMHIENYYKHMLNGKHYSFLYFLGLIR